ncbi:MAG: adenine glycosylase [Acidobacteriota bacterium]|nr:adenine glycosylase [Acidobacteriota bacterium]
MTGSAVAPGVDEAALVPFRALVLDRGRELYRDLPWRRTRDPYAVWLSEVMLQQTQVSRVDGRWQRWLERFPTIDALASSSSADVLDEWQGLGYNRRALALLRAAREIADAGGTMPRETAALVALPGIGPATAAGIRAFAHNLPGVYLETNVRTVILHELYPDATMVPDRELVPLVEATCPKDDSDPRDDPRTWYYALLDYGAHLKRTVPNPSRRSSTHVRQSRFEGSHRQKRAMVVRLLLAHRGTALDAEALARELTAQEVGAGRDPVDEPTVVELLDELSAEGFCRQQGDGWLA